MGHAMTAPRHTAALRSTARWVAVAAPLLALAGCGTGTDPTQPREVRPREPVELDGAPAVPRDPATPSRGLPCAEQDGTVRACGAATDNYKASFNEDPSAREHRTWLAIHGLEVDGTMYALSGEHPLTGAEVTLAAEDGRRATVTVTADRGARATLRTGPQEGLWGPLLTLDESPIQPENDVAVDLEVTVDGDVHVLELLYRRDEALATADEDSLEHGGPGGRWIVAGRPTATNLELGWE